MRIVFCGTGTFATPSLQAILDGGEHQIVCVVSQPPRPAGRGGRLRPAPVAELARENSLNILEVPKINDPDVVETLRALFPEVMVVVEFGQLIRQAVRQIMPLGAFNLHGSLLPELRGAAPVNWAIIRGCSRTGVTTFSLVDRMDAGPMYLQAATNVDPMETAQELKSRLAQIGAPLVCQTLAGLAAGTLKAQEQDESKATLAPKLTKQDGLINWNAQATAIRNLIHGTWPWPGGQTTFNPRTRKGLPVVIARAAVEDCPGAIPGRVDRDLCVGTGQGRLRVLEIQPAGKRLMSWRDFVNGQHVAEGDQFVNLQEPQES